MPLKEKAEDRQTFGRANQSPELMPIPILRLIPVARLIARIPEEMQPILPLASFESVGLIIRIDTLAESRLNLPGERDSYLVRTPFAAGDELQQRIVRSGFGTCLIHMCESGTALCVQRSDDAGAKMIKVFRLEKRCKMC